MKITICFLALVLTLTKISIGQSVIDYQTGSGIEIQPGADVCADQVNINGAFSGGGSICGNVVYVMNLTAFIQGFYNSTTDKMVRDTARVYLRSIIAPYSIIDSSISILDTTGVGTFIFFNDVNGINYYIVLKHRNSIETWSNVGYTFSSNSLTYNFTSASSKAFGDNQILIDNTPARFAIYGGDVNQDDVVDGSDIAIIDNNAFSFVTGYVKSDVNGDDVVDGSDAAIADNNAFNFVGMIRP